MACSVVMNSFRAMQKSFGQNPKYSAEGFPFSVLGSRGPGRDSNPCVCVREASAVHAQSRTAFAGRLQARKPTILETVVGPRSRRVSKV